MRLLDLNPTIKEPGVLVFDCPCNKCGGRVRVPLLPNTNDRGQGWTHTGCLDNLTLTPSVNAGCWHGWIKDGSVV